MQITIAKIKVISIFVKWNGIFYGIRRVSSEWEIDA